MLSRERGYGETGADIIARQDDTEIHIEVIGYKKQGPMRGKDFFEEFFRAVSRLNNPNVTTCVMAMPKEFGLGLRTRANNHRVAWERIGDAFPELEIWLVDVANNEVERLLWREALLRD